MYCSSYAYMSVYRYYIRTCVNLPLTILSDSRDARTFLRLLSFRVSKCECENCKCLILTPGWKTSCESDVTERSKSYIDSECIGDDIRSSVERNDIAVVPGHSKNNPVNDIFKREISGKNIRGY